MEKSCASREMDCACVGIAMCITRELAHFIVCPKRTIWCLLWCLTWEESHFPPCHILRFFQDSLLDRVILLRLVISIKKPTVKTTQTTAINPSTL